MGNSITGLLDSGATHSIVGGEGLGLLDHLNLSIYESEASTVGTADGVQQQVVGYVYFPVTVDGISRTIKFWVVPSLKHSVIFGSDFCRQFGLAIDFSSFSCTAQSKDSIRAVNRQDDILVAAMQGIRSLQDLSPSQMSELQKVKNLFYELSWEKGTKLGRTTRTVHFIDTGNARPIKQRHHQISPYMLVHLNRELDKMLELGVVRPSSSPWSSPVLLVNKTNGEKRFCFDGRKLNSVTKPDAYPLPKVDYILNMLTGARYLSKIDLKSAFWQIPLEDTSCEKTAFVVPSRGLYEFVVLPFGLSNAPQTLQRLMDQVLGPSLEPYVFVFLDDIVISTPTFEQHLQVLREVYQRLKEANLTINAEKCEYCLPSLKYLGFVVDKSGLHTDPEKVAAMAEFPKPQTVTEMKRFLGLCGWYRRFIPKFSDFTSPLTALLLGKRKRNRLVWTQEADNCFHQLKNALINAPLLVSPDFSKPFTIQSDASDVGVAAVLTQPDSKGGEVVIAYASRTLSPAEKKYSVTERECLAVLFGIDKFRPYIEGAKFTVVTDHHSLLWLNNLKDPSGRLARWAVKLQQFEFVLEHRKGFMNVVPDALSRAPLPEVAVIQVRPGNTDKWYHSMLKSLEERPNDYPDYLVKDGVLYKHARPRYRVPNVLPSWRIVVPKSQRLEVLRECHDSPLAAHLGSYKTLERIQELYFWPGMQTHVKRYVSRCSTCSAQKATNVAAPGLMGSSKKATFPWQLISIDILGPLPRSMQGHCYILMVCDWFSKFILLHPLRKANSKSIIKFVEENVFLMFGVPQIITCDNGTQFVSRDFQKLADLYKCKIWYNAKYHPQTNSVERVNRVAGAAIRSYIKDNNHRYWDVHLPKIGFALRTAIHEATGLSPTYINFGRYVPISGDFYDRNSDPSKVDLTNPDRSQYFENLEGLSEIYKTVRQKLTAAYKRNSHTYNLRRRPADSYQVGDRVWKRNYVLSDASKHFSSKLAPKYVPCIVTKVISRLVYRLAEAESHQNLGNWHVKDLKPFRGDDRGDSSTDE
mgnify:CR=1 FL=1